MIRLSGSADNRFSTGIICRDGTDGDRCSQHSRSVKSRGKRKDNDKNERLMIVLAVAIAGLCLVTNAAENVDGCVELSFKTGISVKTQSWSLPIF